MEPAFILNKKDSCNMSNAKTIASCFGYACTNRFKVELKKFIEEQISGATVFQYIQIFAGKHFEQIRPPLKRSK